MLDETSLRFEGLAVGELTEHVEHLTDTLGLYRRAGHDVFVCPLLYDTECLPGWTLDSFLFMVGERRISPDVRRRLAIQLDRCPSWTAYQDEVTGDVSLDDEEVSLAFSIDYALISGTYGHMVACVVFQACPRRGRRMVRNGVGARAVYFLATSDAADFWRSLFSDEDVPEAGFFGLAATAFPDLLFGSDISFGKFAGAYRALRDRVVVALGAINDHFAAALVEGSGVAYQVQALLGRHGLDVSPESPRTHASPKLMRLRDVRYRGEIFRCEWHAKLERHRNRIHFTLPQPALGNKILIGIFVDHLDTH